jgi:predicted O-methyltransferase YrrM
MQIDYQTNNWSEVLFPVENLTNVLTLYEQYRDDLMLVKKKMDTFYAMRNSIGLFPQLGDFEAEITYLKIRESRPESVIEISPASGWSTSWILHALNDNQKGKLYSYDLVDDSTKLVPRRWSKGRWIFSLGDIQRNLDSLPEDAQYLFIDSDHSDAFAQWYIDEIFPRFKPGTIASAHDIIKRSDEPGYGEESIVLCEWLAANNKDCFTAARLLKDKGYDAVKAIRQELGISNLEPADYNSMIYFTL